MIGTHPFLSSWLIFIILTSNLNEFLSLEASELSPLAGALEVSHRHLLLHLCAVKVFTLESAFVLVISSCWKKNSCYDYLSDSLRAPICSVCKFRANIPCKVLKSCWPSVHIFYDSPCGVYHHIIHNCLFTSRHCLPSSPFVIISMTSVCKYHLGPEGLFDVQRSVVRGASLPGSRRDAFFILASVTFLGKTSLLRSGKKTCLAGNPSIVCSPQWNICASPTDLLMVWWRIYCWWIATLLGVFVVAIWLTIGSCNRSDSTSQSCGKWSPGDFGLRKDGRNCLGAIPVGLSTYAEVVHKGTKDRPRLPNRAPTTQNARALNQGLWI